MKSSKVFLNLWDSNATNIVKNMFIIPTEDIKFQIKFKKNSKFHEVLMSY